MATTKLWTIEEVERLPDDDFRYALIRRVLFRMPPPKARHGRVVNSVGRFIGNFVGEHNLGVVYNQSGFLLERDPDVMLEPDLAFVQRARVPENEDTYPMLAPDLVVEVASPSQTAPSIEEKVSIYLTAGVRLIWEVDPEQRTVQVRRPDGSDRLLFERDELDGEDMLPSFRLPVVQIFA